MIIVTAVMANAAMAKVMAGKGTRGTAPRAEKSAVSVEREARSMLGRVASRTRSDFLGEITDYKDDTAITFIRGETVVDLQVGYTFPDTSFLKGLSLLFQGNNMTDALFRQYQTDRNNPTDTKRYGKTYLFGANYKF